MIAELACIAIAVVAVVAIAVLGSLYSDAVDQASKLQEKLYRTEEFLQAANIKLKRIQVLLEHDQTDSGGNDNGRDSRPDETGGEHIEGP